jgi:TATA-box binding protein (TBP) (component of TFIID and TFIIIB)
MELVPIGKFKASDYRISTMTVTGSVNTTVDLRKFFDNIDIDSYQSISFVEYGSNKNEHDQKGVKVEKTKNSQKKPKKRFDNQMTLHMNDSEYKFNIKLFKNGNVQMTGVKNIERGKNIIDELIKIITISNKMCETHDIVEDVEQLMNCNFSTRLMNCDFKVSYKINRGILHKLLNNSFNLTCSYEPCIYQGVKVSFYMNEYSEDGICKCAKKCLGKGHNTICKKITIAVFQSGCVTITGSTSTYQMEFVYDYIKILLENHMNDIYQQTYQMTA